VSWLLIIALPFAMAAHRVSLRWNASTTKNVGYVVFRDSAPITARIHVTQFIDRPAAGMHTYFVKAVNAANVQSAPSVSVTVNVP
jgi:hypothetical protein